MLSKIEFTCDLCGIVAEAETTAGPTGWSRDLEAVLRASDPMGHRLVAGPVRLGDVCAQCKEPVLEAIKVAVASRRAIKGRKTQTIP